MTLNLTENAVILISGGHIGPHVVQLIAVKSCKEERRLDICFTDGAIYCGGTLFYEEGYFPNFTKYSVVQIIAEYTSHNTPIIIKNIKHIEDCKRLLGRPPQTLYEYFKRQGFERLAEQEQKIRKIPKLSQKTNITMEIQIQKTQPTSCENLQNYQTQANQQKTQKCLKQHKTQENINNSEDGQQTKSSVLSIVTQPFNHLSKIKQAQTQKKNLISRNTVIQTHNLYIKDLYERLLQWKILAKVNFLEKYKCSSGNQALSFVLTDQHGDDIKCNFFAQTKVIENFPIEQGKAYSFSGGQIRSKKIPGKTDIQDSSYKDLQISFIHSIDVIPRIDSVFPFNQKKIIKLQDILLRKILPKQIKTIGILKCKEELIQKKQAFLERKNKFTCILSDPTCSYQIQFLLAINEVEKQFKEGHIYILHNFYIHRKQGKIRLQCSHKSYFTDETNNNHFFFEKYRQYLINQQWKKVPYKNLSLPMFTQRTITQMKQITETTQDKAIFSLLDCTIRQLKIDRFYQSCKSCHSTLQKKQWNLLYCMKCKKMVDGKLSCLLKLTLSDVTGSFKVASTGKIAQEIMNISAQQLQKMNKQQQQYYINIVRFSNYLIFLKTQTKFDGQKVFHIQKIQRPKPNTSLNLIREKTVQDKLKMKIQWE